VLRLKVKLLPPFTYDMNTHELILEVSESTTILDILKNVSSKGVIALDKVLDYSENSATLKENVVILADGNVVDDLSKKVGGIQKIVLMPLAPGG